MRLNLKRQVKGSKLVATITDKNVNSDRPLSLPVPCSSAAQGSLHCRPGYGPPAHRGCPAVTGQIDVEVRLKNTIAQQAMELDLTVPT